MDARVWEGHVRPVVRRSPILGALAVLLILGLTWGVSPAPGVWLPWATDKDKIVKSLNEIWRALLAGNRAAAAAYLMGPAAPHFIDQEMARIRMLKIKKYECRVGKVNFDPVSKVFAFVDLEKVATLENGEQVKDRSLKTMRKVGDHWKLLVRARKKRDKTPRSASAAPTKSPNRQSSQTGKIAGAPAPNMPKKWGTEKR
jgi:hypothetical protein